MKQLIEEKDIIEHFANLEHERWSKWQKYMHSKCTGYEHETDMPHCFCNPRKEVMENGNMVIVHSKHSPLTIPFELVERWERQIETPYNELSEQEKQSDRDQVIPYINWHKQSLKQFIDELLVKLEEKIKVIEKRQRDFTNDPLHPFNAHLLGTKDALKGQISHLKELKEELN